MAVGEENIPTSEKEYHKVCKKIKMVLVPDLYGPFIWKDYCAVTFMRRQLTLCEDQFFIAEYDTANTGQSWFDTIDFCFHLIGIPVKADFHQGSRTYKGHIPGKNIEYLGQFIQFADPQETTD